MGYNVGMRVEIELTDKLKEYVDDYIDIGGGENVFCYPDNIIKAIREGIERQNECKIARGVYENRIWCSCGFIKRITGEEENYNFCPKCGTKVSQCNESEVGG